MDTKTYLAAASAVFFAVLSVHLARVILGWEAVIGGWPVPVWVSWVAIVLTGYFVFEGIRLRR